MYVNQDNDKHLMVPHNDSEGYDTPLEDNDNVKNEEQKVVRSRLPIKEILPSLAQSTEIGQFFTIFELVCSEEGVSMDTLAIKVLLLSRLTKCPEVHLAASSLIHRPWAELKRALIGSFGNTARLRREFERRVQGLKYDRDTVTNQVRAIADWSFSLDISEFEIISRLFAVPVLPQRVLEMLITRATRKFPDSHWRRLPLSSLCDLLEETCELLAEFDSLAPLPPRNHAPRIDAVRRVQGSNSAHQQGAGGDPSNWLQAWVARFPTVLHVKSTLAEGLLLQLQQAATEHRRIGYRGGRGHYYLLGYADSHAAQGLLSKVPADQVRVFTPSPPDATRRQSNF